MTSFDVKFDQNDLPEWAQVYSEVVDRCRGDLGYRADVYRAETDDWRKMLIRQAGVRDERVQLNVRIPQSLYQRVRDQADGEWGGIRAFVEEALERAVSGR